MAYLRRLLLAFCLVLPAVYALAQGVVRYIPSQAAVGRMSAISENQVPIGSYTYRLAPGIQIRNSQNLIVLSDTLRNFSGTVAVRYLVDFNGDLSRVWILSDAEINALDPKSLPAQPLPQPMAPATALPGQPISTPGQ
ncbi:MAG: hypothetical protein KGN39_00610 [Betaproteobacteria bacterium]|nr:hypothetical protein [Betaproteobacteria bacterium]